MVIPLRMVAHTHPLVHPYLSTLVPNHYDCMEIIVDHVDFLLFL